jgi:hypothetical protein
MFSKIAVLSLFVAAPLAKLTSMRELHEQRVLRMGMKKDKSPKAPKSKKGKGSRGFVNMLAKTTALVFSGACSTSVSLEVPADLPIFIADSCVAQGGVPTFLYGAAPDATLSCCNPAIFDVASIVAGKAAIPQTVTKATFDRKQKALT